MKKLNLLFLSASLITSNLITAQNPFASIGKKSKPMLSLSDGKYVEHFENDSVRQIGSAMVNVYSDQIVAFVDRKEQSSKIHSQTSSRFLSVDPLARSFPYLTPYQYASNMPIAATDLDGLEANLSIYGAGLDIDPKTGQYTRKSESTFKKEADQDVEWKNASQAYQIHTGEALMQTLKQETINEGSISYLSIFSHGANDGVILDNGQYGYEWVTDKKWDVYKETKLTDVFRNKDIKFAPNALVVFAGCSMGQDKFGNGMLYSVAKDITEKFGIATIGADSHTMYKKGGTVADNKYYLFYKDENDVTQKVGLGKILNNEAINFAKDIVNAVAKKKEEAKAAESNKKGNE